MNQILDGDMRAPNRKTFKASHKPKKINLERFLSVEDMFNLTLNDHRLIMYFVMTKPHKKGIDDGEWNQTIKYSHSDLKEYISNKNVFYAAIKKLIDLDIISKIPDQPAMFRFNPLCVSNLTQDQAINMGVVKPNIFNTK